MTEHGGYGMKLDGITIAKPKPRACAIAYYKTNRCASVAGLRSVTAKRTCSGFDRHPSVCGKTTSYTQACKRARV